MEVCKSMSKFKEIMKILFGKDEKTDPESKKGGIAFVGDLSKLPMDGVLNSNIPNIPSSTNPNGTTVESNSVYGYSRILGDETELRLNQTDDKFTMFSQLSYNPDLEPFQHPLLRRVLRIDPDNVIHREALFESSPYLRTQTFDIIFKLIDVGWKYKTKETDTSVSEEGNLGKRDRLAEKVRELELEQMNRHEQSMRRSKSRIEENAVDKIQDEGETSDEYIKDTPLDKTKEDKRPDVYIEKWSDDLKIAVIRSLARALVVGSDFICRIKEDKDPEPFYQTFSVNDVHRAIFSDFRRIEEVYFNIRAFNNAKCKSRNPLNQGLFKLGFLTQYSEDESKPSDVNGYELQSTQGKNNRNTQNKQIYRECVVITPIFDMNVPFGRSAMYNEIITASQKLYLRFYEMLYIHKGGVDKNVVFPAASDEIRQKMMRYFSRGMLSLGFYTEMNVQADINVQTGIKFDNVPMPTLPFSEIDSHLNSDGILTQQGISGTAEGNNMSATASVTNDINDDEVVQTFQLYLHKVIKDINEVFFGADPDTYDVVFNRIPTDLIDRMQYRQQIYEKGRDLRERQLVEAAMRNQDENRENVKQESNSSYPDYYNEQNSAFIPHLEGRDPFMDFYIMSSNIMNNQRIQGLDEEIVNRGAVVMEQNSVSDDYITYRGNMFDSGTYAHRERDYDQYVTLTPDDIKRYCEKDEAGRTGYLDIDHSSQPMNLKLTEGVGYLKTVGYDSAKFQDITDFHLKKDVWEELGKPDSIKVSPRYVRKTTKGGGNDIGLIDCAVVVNTKPRTELSGLKSGASLKRKP